MKRTTQSTEWAAKSTVLLNKETFGRVFHTTWRPYQVVLPVFLFLFACLFVFVVFVVVVVVILLFSLGK